MEWSYGDFELDDDNRKTDSKAIHELLKDTYWARGREVETVQKTIANSHCFNVWKDGRQVGFARVVTDYAVFGWIGDVIIDEGFRGLGLGKVSFLDHAVAEQFLPSQHRSMLMVDENPAALLDKFETYQPPVADKAAWALQMARR